MTIEHIEFLVEEPSMEAFLRAFLVRVFGDALSFEIYPFNGKTDLLARLEERLRGYATWLPGNWRIIVLIDRDDEECKSLKDRLEKIGSNAKLLTRSSGGTGWQIAFRICIEELEAWYFGEWDAVRLAFPRVGKHVPKSAAYRNPDQIAGGTWEAFEREMQRVGYFAGGLRKIEAARSIGRHFAWTNCTSPSFKAFSEIILEIAGVQACQTE